MIHFDSLSHAIFGPTGEALGSLDPSTNTFHDFIGDVLATLDPITNTFHDGNGMPLFSIENLGGG